MVSPAAPPAADPQEEPNPILEEMAKLNTEGDDADILKEIADLNAREESGEEAAEAPAATEAAVAEATEVPVAVAPKAPEVKAPVTPTAPVVDPREQYIAKLEEQQRKAQEESDARALDQYTAGIKENFIAQGLTEEVADQFARQFVQPIWQGFQQHKAHQAELAAERQRVRQAAALAQEHGVPLDTLMGIPTSEAMRQTALALSAKRRQDAEIAALKAEMEKMKKASVPPQTFDSNRAAPVAPTDERSQLDLYNKGVRNTQTIAAAKRAAGG